MSTYFSKELQIRQDIDFASEHLRGQDIFEYEMRSGRAGGISEPAYLQNMERFVVWLRAQPEVDQVTAFSDVIKRLNQNMNSGSPDFYSIPENPELAAQYLLLYELSLPFGLDLNNQINIDKSSTRLSVVIKDMTLKAQESYHLRVEDWVASNNLQDMVASPTGVSKILKK